MGPFEAIFVPDELAEAVSDRAWLEAMLEVERALANAESLAGVIPADAAGAIAAACDPGRFDVHELAVQGRSSGNPAEPLVRALRDAVDPAWRDAVHRGATSQDVVDTAAVLVARRALGQVIDETDRLAAAAAELARLHRDTPMAARTLLQQAVPTTFGLKAAGWLVAVLDARRGLLRANDGLAAQLGGAAGTLAALGAKGGEVAELFAAQLDLPLAPLPWHANRVRMAELGSALAVVAGVAAKIGTDVALLQQTEVGEVLDPGAGGSSTMPHKQNPVASAVAVACARRTAAHASVLLGSLVGEHERAAGSWHAEWAALSGALALAGGGLAAVARLLEQLEADPGRMRANMRDELYAERDRLGLQADEDYLGQAASFVDRALAVYAGETEEDW
ncbi:MAG TPA: 3-carboxy-cis,cis-muconate cycloisomerase [Gaiellaceae bacterium]|jgi:3-carboxy-cis,cis-muconate cycloisomerase